MVADTECNIVISYIVSVDGTAENEFASKLSELFRLSLSLSLPYLKYDEISYCQNLNYRVAYIGFHKVLFILRAGLMDLSISGITDEGFKLVNTFHLVY